MLDCSCHRISKAHGVRNMYKIYKTMYMYHRFMAILSE